MGLTLVNMKHLNSTRKFCDLQGNNSHWSAFFFFFFFLFVCYLVWLVSSLFVFLFFSFFCLFFRFFFFCFCFFCFVLFFNLKCSESEYLCTHAPNFDPSDRSREPERIQSL